MKRSTVVLLLGGEGRTVFQPVLGRPLGAYALEAATRIGPDAVLVMAGPAAAGREDWEGLIGTVETKTPVFLLVDGKRAGRRREASSRLSSPPGRCSGNIRIATSSSFRPTGPCFATGP